MPKKKDPKLERAGVSGYNKPKRTPNHPTKKYVVVAKEGDKTKRDQAVTPTTGITPGSHEWCVAWVPWANGFTYGQMTWDTVCDTNDDGVYNELDEGWEG